jgi:hypothetical protein
MHTKLEEVNMNERDHLEDLGIDGSNKTDFKRSRVWRYGLCEHCIEHAGKSLTS